MHTPSSTLRRLRESPFLEPLVKRAPRQEVLSPPQKPLISLSHETRQRWMREALDMLDTTTLSLGLQDQLVNSPQHRRRIETLIIDAPTLRNEVTQVIEQMTQSEMNGETSISSPKRSPVMYPWSSSLPLYTRGTTKRSPTKPPHRVPERCQFSHEMLQKLHTHLEDKIRGNHWQNEIRSRLARPLSASTFSNRHEQLNHPLAAPQYSSTSSLYPYAIEAHDGSRRMGRMYRKHCYRQVILTNVRRLAIAIRFFRRVTLPWLVRAHRRRRHAAIIIQRCVRRWRRWKQHIMRPFAVKTVALILRQAKARVVIILILRRLVQRRRARRRVIHRWVAKTRVALFVHRVWIANWIRGKRERNLARLRLEVAQLEASDVDVRREYATILGTAYGRKLLKKELVAWRQSVKPQSLVASDSTTSDTLVRLRQCFGIFDLDGSGALDLDEFELMLAHLRATGDRTRAKLTTAQIRDLFATLDRDGDGSVTCQEWETWWLTRRSETTSASVSLLSGGVDRLVLTGHGMLFWLLGKKQQLERKFVKKRMIKQAQQHAKGQLLTTWQHVEATNPHEETRRCRRCGRRFGLQRDLDDHQTFVCKATEWNVDAFVWRMWIKEEELRLLEDEPQENDDDASVASTAISQAEI